MPDEDQNAIEAQEKNAIEYAVSQVLQPEQREVKTDSGLIVVRDVPTTQGGYL